MNISRKSLFISSFLFSALIILSPIIIRLLGGNNSLIGAQSYYHLTITNHLMNASVFTFSTPYDPTLFHYFSSLFITGVLSPLFAQLFPILLGLFSSVIFTVIALRMNASLYQSALSLALFLVSPLFIVLFTMFTPYSLLLFLFLISWWLYLKQSPFLWITWLLMLFVDASGYLVGSLLMLSHALYQGRVRGPLLLSLTGGVLLLALKFFAGYYATDVLVTQTTIASFFMSTESAFGYSFFIVILSLIGLVNEYKSTNKNLLFTFIISALFVTSFYVVSARVIMLPVIALIAARGMEALVRRRWEVISIRNFTLFVILLTLLFTFTLTISNQARATPSSDLISTLDVLEGAPNVGVVLSSAENGVLIEYVVEKEVFVKNVRSPHLKTRMELANNIFLSHNYDDTKKQLLEHNITHILIDQDMRDGLVWTADKQGLLYFLEPSTTFIRIGGTGEYDLYRVILSES